MLTEIPLMTFVKSFQWYVDHTTGSSSQKSLKGFQSTYHWKLFTKSLKGFQSTYHRKLFTKVIKRIFVKSFQCGMLTEILLMTFVKCFQWYVD
jgi:hypothetical protein